MVCMAQYSMYLICMSPDITPSVTASGSVRAKPAQGRVEALER